MSAALQQKPEIKIKLTVVKGPHAGQVFQLSKGAITLGRGPENNVVLMNDPQISRIHAQINVVKNGIEVVNLSQKNAVVVDGASVQKWQLVNQSVFTLGDSEIKIEYDLGQSVVNVQSASLAEVVPIKPTPITAPVPEMPAQQNTNASAVNNISNIEELNKAIEAAQNKQRQPAVASGASPKSKKRTGPPVVRSQAPAQRPRAPQTFQQPLAPMQPNMQVGKPLASVSPNLDLNANYTTQTSINRSDSLMASPMFKFILVAIIVVAGAFSYLQTPTKKSQTKKIAPTLKYEDEVSAQVFSKKEKDLEEDRNFRLKLQNSSANMRINENFIRGMRDYQSGNYVRAMEHFQLVLNLEPEHQLAKRHMYLSRVRFDEVVQAKLMLGDSYYKKHNFRMCTSMYTQVKNMLEGKNSDQKLLLAEKRARECDLASQGIR